MTTNALHTHTRLDWVDQVKGFTIFLVVYGHNFPFCEKYIYSFHMPLFIMVAGFFHPKISRTIHLKKRFLALVVPYFAWSLFLFLFWVFIGRDYGESGALGLSWAKNFIGIFYAQGGQQYMDWGIPLWFLPALYMMFAFMHFAKKIKDIRLQCIALTLIAAAGFSYSHFFSDNLPWSVNIAMAALSFYAFGYYLFDWMSRLPGLQSVLLLLAMGAMNFLLYSQNIKIDMYRAHFGNEFLFLASGISGSLFVLLFFKVFPVFKILEFIGKFSLVILALQLLALSAIKLILRYIFHQPDFDFSEPEKFFYAILQVVLLVPGFFLINKYIPFLNGGPKKI